MRKLTNNLDERQEKQLLHIEKNGCWFAFWALIASIFIQENFLELTTSRHLQVNTLFFLAWQFI